MQKKFGADLKTPNDLSVPEYEGVLRLQGWRWRRRARPMPTRCIAGAVER